VLPLVSKAGIPSPSFVLVPFNYFAPGGSLTTTQVDRRVRPDAAAVDLPQCILISADIAYPPILPRQ